jgi:tRNA threonylcarbamoyladenosine biosynthesis protein TsaE
MRILTKNDKETFEYAQKLALSLRGGEVLGLIGDLGAGKTVFSQGLAKGLSIKRRITSPTFVVMKTYSVNKPTIRQFCHIDAYRLQTEQDLLNIGANDYIGASDTITVIEWADRVMDIIPKGAQFFDFKIINNHRIITIKKYDQSGKSKIKR